MGEENGYIMSFLHELNSLFFKITISYILYFWFFPLKNKSRYVLVALGLFAINIVAYYYTDNLFHPGYSGFWIQFASSALTYTAFGTVFYVIYALKKAYYSELKINQLEQEKKVSELKALKATINPHFLFNTLNTIYANALKKDEKTSDLILKLSDGFRYMLHEGQKEYVTIEQELEHLRDYVHLQKERLAKKVIVHFTTNIDDERELIAPLLCIGFVENAFKYTSILNGQQHKISIRMELKNKTFKFSCINPFNTKAVDEIDVDWKESGVGIKNTKERLALLYPQTHTLTINEEDAVFTTKLEIKL